ncbi:DNA repair protein XRCC2 [Aplochiton taeniatus]
MTENGAQLFARLEGRRSLKDIEARLFPEDGGPDHGEVVELHGLEGSGKTALLYHLVCRCVLPQRCGGLELQAVFIDTDHHFDMLRLVTILENRLAHYAQGDADSSEEEVRECLSRLLVVHCSSSSQLLLSLHYLETSFCSRPALSLLLLDSISAFYWMDRCGGGESQAKQEGTLRKFSELLSRLLRDYGITVFATSHAIMRNYASDTVDASSSSSSSSFSSAPPCPPPGQGGEYSRPYLCRAWQRLVTHRLVCTRADAGTQAGTLPAVPPDPGPLFLQSRL